MRAPRTYVRIPEGEEDTGSRDFDGDGDRVGVEVVPSMRGEGVGGWRCVREAG